MSRHVLRSFAASLAILAFLSAPVSPQPTGRRHSLAGLHLGDPLQKAVRLYGEPRPLSSLRGPRYWDLRVGDGVWQVCRLIVQVEGERITAIEVHSPESYRWLSPWSQKAHPAEDLATGEGLYIGELPTRVEQRLGRPTKRTPSDFIYSYPDTGERLEVLVLMSRVQSIKLHTVSPTAETPSARRPVSTAGRRSSRGIRSISRDEIAYATMGGGLVIVRPDTAEETMVPCDIPLDPYAWVNGNRQIGCVGGWPVPQVGRSGKARQRSIVTVEVKGGTTGPGDSRFAYRQLTGEKAKARLVNGERDWDDADWSWDGRRICAVDLKGDLYTMNADGSGLRLLATRAQGIWRECRWSPDGRQIIGCRFDLVNVATGKVRTLPNPLPDHDPWTLSWSPDGRRIAFQAKPHSGGRYQIFAMDADGSNVRRITSLPGSGETPCFSCNGREIAYIYAHPVNDRGRVSWPQALWVVGSDGRNPQRLTRDRYLGLEGVQWTRP